MDEREATLWTMRFDKLIAQVTSTVGCIIKIGQWEHTSEGSTFLAECLRGHRNMFENSSKRKRWSSF